MKWFIIFFISVNCYALVVKSDPIKTPGSLCNVASKDFIELRYKEMIAICKRNVTTSIKNKVYLDYSVPLEERDLYTIDHKKSLFLGGSNDQDNLWPQPKIFSSVKLENHVYLLLKNGYINQEQSVQLILSIK